MIILPVSVSAFADEKEPRLLRKAGNTEVACHLAGLLTER